jgi:hypothetical protein
METHMTPIYPTVTDTFETADKRVIKIDACYHDMLLALCNSNADVTAHMTTFLECQYGVNVIEAMEIVDYYASKGQPLFKGEADARWFIAHWAAEVEHFDKRIGDVILMPRTEVREFLDDFMTGARRFLAGEALYQAPKAEAEIKPLRVPPGEGWITISDDATIKPDLDDGIRFEALFRDGTISEFASVDHVDWECNPEDPGRVVAWRFSHKGYICAADAAMPEPAPQIEVKPEAEVEPDTEYGPWINVPGMYMKSPVYEGNQLIEVRLADGTEVCNTAKSFVWNLPPGNTGRIVAYRMVWRNPSKGWIEVGDIIRSCPIGAPLNTRKIQVRLKDGTETMSQLPERWLWDEPPGDPCRITHYRFVE